MQDTSVAILVFSKMSQVDDYLKALDLLEIWTPEIEKRVTEHLNNAP